MLVFYEKDFSALSDRILPAKPSADNELALLVAVEISRGMTQV
jgi:hypothetical protein